MPNSHIIVQDPSLEGSLDVGSAKTSRHATSDISISCNQIYDDEHLLIFLNLIGESMKTSEDTKLSYIYPKDTHFE